jgi:hypothetical protein
MTVIDNLLAQLSFATVEQKGEAYSLTVPKEKLYETASLLRKNESFPFQ